MNKETIYIKFVPSKISDVWLADTSELLAELERLMPDVRRYTTRGFRKHKHYRIEDIARCSDSDAPGEQDGCNVIELEVIPNNI